MPRSYITDVEYCTNCKEKLEDFKIIIKLDYEFFRKTSVEAWEEVDNSSVKSNEMLCKNCFDNFVDIISKGMEV